MRIGLVAAAMAVFVGVASVIKPPPQNASAINPAPRGSDQAGRSSGAGRGADRALPAPLSGLAHPQGWKLIGMLESAEHRVLCYASPNGPRYTICALDGRVLQADLPADEVYRAFPSIDLETMRDDPSGTRGSSPLMLAE